MAAEAGVSDSLISVQRELARMVEASRTLNYRGVAIYELGGAVRTVSVTHAVRDDRQLERLEFLDGPRGEVVRSGERDDCVQISDLLLKGGAAGGDGVPVARLGDHYRASLRNDDRIAGRQVRQIYLEPRDGYRYGHLLSVDVISGLLLQEQVLDARSEVVERIKFTTVDIGAVIDETAGEARLKNSVAVPAAACPEPVAETDRRTMPWQLGWVPPGFVPMGPARVTHGGVQEMHYTDGLDTFSVFVDSETSPRQDVEVRRGATVVYVLHRRDADRSHVVCVVGEVPAAAARRIAEAVRPAPHAR